MVNQSYFFFSVEKRYLNFSIFKDKMVLFFQNQLACLHLYNHQKCYENLVKNAQCVSGILCKPAEAATWGIL